MRLARGFTLIELLITVVILGIIASIALPSYTSYLTRSKLVEAHSMLADLRVKQEQRFQDARTYSAALCAPTGAAAAQVKYFDFACPAAPIGRMRSATSRSTSPRTRSCAWSANPAPASR